METPSKECTEIALFQVAEENASHVIKLSYQIFAEMNATTKVILKHKVLVNNDKPNELCWQLTWRDAETARTITKQWPQFPSTKEFQTLVEKNIYYGHFSPQPAPTE